MAWQPVRSSAFDNGCEWLCEFVQIGCFVVVLAVAQGPKCALWAMSTRASQCSCNALLFVITKI